MQAPIPGTRSPPAAHSAAQTPPDGFQRPAPLETQSDRTPASFASGSSRESAEPVPASLQTLEPSPAVQVTGWQQRPPSRFAPFTSRASLLQHVPVQPQSSGRSQLSLSDQTTAEPRRLPSSGATAQARDDPPHSASRSARSPIAPSRKRENLRERCALHHLCN